MILIFKNFLEQIINLNKYSIFILYVLYTFLRYPKKPFLQYHSSKGKYIKKMKSLHQSYKAYLFTNVGFLQSYLQLHRVVKPISRKSYRLKVPYDGEIILDVCDDITTKRKETNLKISDKNIIDEKNDLLFDKDDFFVENNDKKYYCINNKHKCTIIKRNIRKNVLLVHGFNGSSNSKYIIGLSHHFRKAGYRIFCFNARGTKEILNNSIFFHIGWTVDLHVAVEFILHNFGGSLEIYGFSMGGNWVTKYLGEKQCLSPRIIKGGAICLPFDFFKIEKWMENEKWIYRKRFLNNILTRNFFKYIKRNKEIFKNAVDLDLLFKCKSLRDIDTILTKKIFNIKSLNEYYQQESSVRHLKNIKIPFLILNSKDDPIIPEFIIDKTECLKNKNILLVVTPYGGHLGFLKNSLKDSLADDIILDFSKHFE